jgi:hypothetical protein
MAKNIEVCGANLAKAKAASKLKAESGKRSGMAAERQKRNRHKRQIGAVKAASQHQSVEEKRKADIENGVAPW